MKNLALISGYNNYYNRKMKRGTTLNEYVLNNTYPDPVDPYDIAQLPYFLLENTNFNPNDGIVTTHVFNQTTVEDPDYLIVLTPGTNVVEQRWFVMEFQRLRNGQYRAQLRRDVVADYYDEFLNAPAFIEKATVSNSDPAIFNSEDMSFNQIKVSEENLENNLHTPWLVAYMARKDGDGNYIHYQGSLDIAEPYGNIEVYADYTDFQNNCGFYDLLNVEKIYVEDFTFGIPYTILPPHQQIPGVPHTITRGMIGVTKNYYSAEFLSNVSGVPKFQRTVNKMYPNILASDYASVYAEILSKYNELYTIDPNLHDLTGWLNPALVNRLQNISYIKIGNDYKKVTLSYQTLNALYTSSDVGALKTLIYTRLKAKFGGITDFDVNTCVMQILNDGTAFKVTISISDYIPEIQATYDWQNVRDHTQDAPYEIIAAPLYDTTFIDTNVNKYSKGNFAMAWFQELARKYSGSYLYDLQIVPYSPIDVQDITAISKIYLMQNTIERAVAFKLSDASFSIHIDKNITLDENWKVGNLTELYRIVSPNGVGAFDFSPYKNNGVAGFDIDVTLLPYTPYIKISPTFAGLYGQDFDDYRGLICAGDFSIAVTSSQWEQYANNNKYYQQIFDRQIDHMETENKYQRINQITGIVGNTIGGAAGGALATGSPVGAVGGAVASAAGGIADYILSEKMREESIDYTKDQFGYNLQTIKARGDTLTRSTSYNKNNKYFPYLEKYDCTEVEKQALRDKIYYNGMTVMRIGKISDFLRDTPTYIKAKLIKVVFSEMDYHVLNELANELDKGVFL